MADIKNISSFFPSQETINNDFLYLSKFLMSKRRILQIANGEILNEYMKKYHDINNLFTIPMKNLPIVLKNTLEDYKINSDKTNTFETEFLSHRMKFENCIFILKNNKPDGLLCYSGIPTVHTTTLNFYPFTDEFEFLFFQMFYNFIKDIKTCYKFITWAIPNKNKKRIKIYKRIIREFHGFSYNFESSISNYAIGGIFSVKSFLKELESNKIQPNFIESYIE